MYVDLNEIIFVSCSQQSKLQGIERNSAINLFYIRISIFWFSLLAQENIWKSDSINTRLIKIYFSCYTCTVIPSLYPCNRWEMSLEKGIKSSFTRSPLSLNNDHDLCSYWRNVNSYVLSILLGNFAIKCLSCLDCLLSIWSWMLMPTTPKKQNKRPMGHNAHLRNSSNQ